MANKEDTTEDGFKVDVTKDPEDPYKIIINRTIRPVGPIVNEPRDCEYTIPFSAKEMYILDKAIELRMATHPLEDHQTALIEMVKDYALTRHNKKLD